MKIDEFKHMLENASNNAEIKIDDGEIVIVEPKHIEFKYKVGDKMQIKSNGKVCTIKRQCDAGDMPSYEMQESWANILAENQIEPYRYDITAHIASFEDAKFWCLAHDKKHLVDEYEKLFGCSNTTSDLLAYLKLRIITCALNEGWEPTFDENERRWYVQYRAKLCNTIVCFEAENWSYQSPATLFFKSNKLAYYAAMQFNDIYAKFCICKK